MQHLRTITKTNGFRNYKNTALLDKTADYILSVFKQYADTAYFQPYTADGRTYKNVVCRFGSNINKPIVVVGAHYDVCGNQEGADDNASGVVGILETARLLAGQTLNYPVEIVAYCLEEPPYFRTEKMGSYIHAKSLYDSGTDVYGMVVLEMIGYFDDKAKTQSYPVKVLKVAYGTKGNFILLARKTNSGEFVKKFTSGFKENAEIKTESLKAPAKIQGIDFSDHLNYWKFGYDALMVTNTAFYRNHNYHHTSDKMETLDIPKMMKVIDTTVAAIINL
jgi:Zn-dependent M28 family amino/carboxypeptidase